MFTIRLMDSRGNILARVRSSILPPVGENHPWLVDGQEYVTFDYDMVFWGSVPGSEETTLQFINLHVRRRTGSTQRD